MPHRLCSLQVPIEGEEAAAQEKPAAEQSEEEKRKAEEAKEGESVEVAGEPPPRAAPDRTPPCKLASSSRKPRSGSGVCGWARAQGGASLYSIPPADEDEDEEKKPKTKKVTETITEWKALNDNQVGAPVHSRDVTGHVRGRGAQGKAGRQAAPPLYPAQAGQTCNGWHLDG